MLDRMTDAKTNRLTSIDALRGIAALSVLLYHDFIALPAGPLIKGSEALNRFIMTSAGYGRTGVFLFFVLSGFCIHLRWASAKASGAKATLSFVAFWKRRLWRLYPTYLIILIIAVVVTVSMGIYRLGPPLYKDVLMHLLLVHNFSAATTDSINGPFWTLAVEEQLYALYFILLWMRNRMNWKTILVICASARIGWFAFGYIAFHQFHANIYVRDGAANFWLLWVLGAIAVEAWVGLIELPKWCYSMPLAIMALLSAAWLDAQFSTIDYSSHVMAYRVLILTVDPLWGVAFFLLMNSFVVREKKWNGEGAFSTFTRLLAQVGLFSYSLYLTHQILIERFPWFNLVLLGLDPSFVRWLLIFAFPPIALLLAWMTFQLVEKRFLFAKR